MMTTLTFEHISKFFDRSDSVETRRIAAVDNISLKLASGDVLAILGPSGCGKSTLLRLAAGIYKPDSGRVLFDEQDLHDIPLRDRGIGMVFQEGALAPHWAARRSVGFFLELRQREREVPERLAQIARITGFGLDVLLDRRPAHLSGGEQQRIGIARALSRDMRLLLFDEPFANLDAKYRTEARVELKRLLNAFPVTSVYVTHDQIEAIALSHRIAVMREGKLEQIGTYQQLYSNPINLFVATFIGTPIMNLFKGRVENGFWQGENFGGYAMRKDLSDGVKVTVGIRPEHIHLAPDGTYGVVEQAMPFFAERYQVVTVHLAGERWSLIVPLKEPIEVGSTIRCAFDPAGLLFFDTNTGQRIG